MKIAKKPVFSQGFSMNSGGSKAPESMNNPKILSPECFGTPENRPGWAGLIGLAGEVVAG